MRFLIIVVCRYMPGYDIYGVVFINITNNNAGFSNWSTCTFINIHCTILFDNLPTKNRCKATVYLKLILCYLHIYMALYCMPTKGLLCLISNLLMIKALQYHDPCCSDLYL